MSAQISAPTGGSPPTAATDPITKVAAGISAIYYFAFNTETYTSVSPRQITKSGYLTIDGLNDQEKQAVLTLLKPNNAKGTFNSGLTRLEIVFKDKSVLLVDRDGNTQWGAHHYNLSPKTRYAIHRILSRHRRNKE
jgi:hypothetical protein